MDPKTTIPYDLPFRTRVRLAPEGPYYVGRIQGDKAYFTRRLADGTTELIVRPMTTTVYFDDEGER